MTARQIHVSRTSQRGAATLVVVMILFFIMAMMAAYANRSLVFEQRIASNYYRSGLSVEVAEAGIEWTLAQLNGANINSACSSDGTATTSFRQRYLNIDASTRLFTPILASGGYDAPVASCIRRPPGSAPPNTSPWVCNCPDPVAIATTPAAVAGAQIQPSFQVGLNGGVSSSGSSVVTIQAVGCTGSTSSTCITANTSDAARQLVAGSYATVQAALVSALKSPSTAALTIRQNVNDGNSRLGLHNIEPAGNGLLLWAGGTDTVSDSRLETLPGTPARTNVLTGDASLSTGPIEAFFARFFGMAPVQYQNQPAIQDAGCTDAACSDANISGLVTAGARLIWVDKPLTLSGNGTFGTATNPVVIVVNGPVTISGSVTINGVLYAAGNITASAPQVIVNGALIGAGMLSVDSGLMDIRYQASIVNIASNGMGSFVRVPGSWWEGTPF